MSKQALKTTLYLLSAFAILANGVVPVAFHPPRAYAEAPHPPAPSATPTPTPSKPEGKASTQNLALPEPGDLPPAAEQARARQAMEVVLAKYREYYGSSQTLDITGLKIEDEWAYAIASELYLLARRLPDGTWRALLPDSDGLYYQWLEAAPQSLIPTEAKQGMQSQAAITAQRRPPAKLIVQPPVTSTMPGPVESRSVFNLAGPTPSPTPVLSTTDTLTLNSSISKFDKVLSNGQLVYGPNIGNFDVTDYLSKSAPHLLPYAEQIYRRSEYYSINPKVYLTLMEMSTQLLSNKDATANEIENPFDFGESGFLNELDRMSNLLFDAYYLHLYTFSPLPVEKRSLPPLRLVDGSLLDIPPEVNAGTYSVMVALAPLRDAAGIATVVDSSTMNSFYRTYLSLFPDDDPLNESNHIYIPGEISALAVPPDLLQLPYLRNESWKFNGVHDALGGDPGSSFSDASSIDLSPGWPGWDSDTANMWVAAAATGTPTKISNCNFKITHQGGWETVYYHLENIQGFGSTIQQNDRIGVLANTKPEALCDGGSSSGPHVHFTLKLNGARVPIDGTALSGWYLHSGRWNYDTDRNYMWLERSGTRKYVNDWLLNDGGGTACSAPSLVSPGDGETKNSRSVTLDWNAPNCSGLTGYTLHVTTGSGPEDGTIFDSGVGPTEFPYTFPSDGTFYWHVAAWANGQRGPWASRRIVINTNSNPPPATGNWQAKYVQGSTCWWDTNCANWSNPNYSETISGPTLDKNWGSSAPTGGMNGDNWVGNFEATINFPAGNYVFYLENDDGAKLWLNGQNIQDRGGSGSGRICNGQGGYAMSGNQVLRVLLREDGGDARVRLTWDTNTSVCMPPTPAVPTLQSPGNGSVYNEGAGITLSWNSASNATEYYAEYWGGPAGTINSGWQSGTSWTIGAQWVGYTYSWHVKARNGTVESGWSDIWTFGVMNPSNLSAGVSPSPVTMVGDGYAAVTYSFHESAGTSAHITQRIAQFILLDGATPVSDPIGPFDNDINVPGGGSVQWGDNVYLPPYVVSNALDRGASSVLLREIFSGQDTLNRSVSVQSDLRIDFVTCGDSTEPNNTPGQATAISIGQTRSAYICPRGDSDFYKFTGTAGDKIVVDIDAKINGSSLDSQVFLLDSDGTTVLDENDDEIPAQVQDSHLGYPLPHDGTYYIKVRAWDHPSAGGNDYFYTVRLFTDNTAPSSAAITSPGNDAWLDPSQETVTASASDSGSGISRIEFLWHSADWESSDWVWLGADEDGRDGWSWDFDTSGLAEQRGGAFYIWACDWAGNWTGAGVWNWGIDRTPPTAQADVSLMYGDAPFLDFWVRWSGSDNLSGVASYDVQYRDGTGGTWTDLVTGTTNTNYRFLGQNGHTYYFRARARDVAGNRSEYPSGDGDTQYTVQVCATSADGGEPDGSYAAARVITTDGAGYSRNSHVVGDKDWFKFVATAGVTYTLATANTGGHADTVVSLYNSNGTTLLALNDDDPDNWPASRLEWGAPRDGTYYVKVEHWDPYAYGCTTAYELSIAETGRFEVSNEVFLPIILRSAK